MSCNHGIWIGYDWHSKSFHCQLRKNHKGNHKYVGKSDGVHGQKEGSRKFIITWIKLKERASQN